MPISNYPHGFKNGVTMRDIPVDIRLNGTGHVWWVDSAHGSDGNDGSFTRPFATIDYAVGRCTADQGDIIYVAAGHVETVIAAAGLALDVAGINIIFLGEGSNRGYITFTTAVTADMDVDADNVTMVNPRFVAGIDALTGPIDVNAANFKIINAEWYDGTSIDTTDCMVATSAAIGLIVNGWRYVIGDEGGTQKQSNIQLNGVDNAVLTNVDIAGDFATGNIENVTDEVLNIRLENIQLKSTNAGPIPGIVLDANATGFAKNLDVRVASGTTYVSSVAKLNWDGSSLGYATDGYGGDPIGTGDSSSIEGKIDAIQADIGADVNSTTTDNINGKIGTDTEMNDNSLYDLIGAGAKTLALSTAIGSSVDGTTTDTLHGKIGTDTEMADKSLYDLLGVGSKTLAISTSLGSDVDIATTDTVHGKLGTDTELADRSLFDLLGGDGFATYPAAAAPANDVSVAEVIRAVYDDTDTISGAALPAAPASNSLASFVASGGTALGTELADSKSIVDAVGSDGATLAYGSGSPLGAIGTIHIVTKVLTSSAILTTGADVTGVSSGGDLLIEDITLNTDATGLAAGTNILFTNNSISGEATVFGEAVANLGANKTRVLADGTAASNPGEILESGKKIRVASTGAHCTGGGTMTVMIKFRRITAGATIAAA